MCRWGFSKAELERLTKSVSMADLYLCFAGDAEAGKKIFLQKVEEFDQLNVKLIDLYAHHLENLEKHLTQDEKKLAANLRPLTEILYWRRKPSN